jgi:spore coat polysaccharide biosynthesis protein SpsF
MTDTVAFVQARMGSSRLPGKVLLPIGERRVLGWVVDRCRGAETVDDVVVLIGDNGENDALTEWCNRRDCRYVRGAESDLLARYRDGVSSVDPGLIVRVTGDCPFVPSDEIDRVVAAHSGTDAVYTSNRTDRMPIGSAVDVIEPSVLDALADGETTHPVVPLLDNLEEWATTITGNSDLERFDGTHFAVDTPSDYWRLTDALAARGPEPVAILEWLSRNPAE